jgi:hypothetical protein
VLRAAIAAGPVSEFAVQRQRLSEVFREAVSERQAPPAQAGTRRVEVNQ